MSVNTALKSQFDKSGDAAVFARGVLNGMDTAVRGPVVNRTHRVVRQRAKMMQARRSHVRSLTLPLIVCSVLLVLTVLAVWSGLYQYQAAEAADAEHVAGGDHVAQIAVELEHAERRAAVGGERDQLAARAGDVQAVGRGVPGDAARRGAHGAARELPYTVSRFVSCSWPQRPPWRRGTGKSISNRD